MQSILASVQSPPRGTYARSRCVLLGHAICTLGGRRPPSLARQGACGTSGARVCSCQDLLMNVVGAASVDVTPSVGTTLAGYSREVGSIGVLDRLTASAFVVGDGVRRVCLISVDTLGLATPFADEVHFEVSETLGLPQHAVFVFATHTHSGPDCFGTDEASREYMEGLRHALLRAARTASDSLRPCRITWSQIPTSIGVNRRERTSEGSVVMGVNPDGPVDRRLGSVQFTDPETSELLATLLIATAHANVLQGDSNVVSADYPGWSRGVLEQALGCPVLVVIGSAGNVNARWRGSQRDLERMARMVGGGVLEQVAGAEPSDAALAVRSAHEVLTIRLRPIPDVDEAAAMAAAAQKNWGQDATSWLTKIDHLRSRGESVATLSVEVAAFALGGLVIGGVPLETCSELALEAQDVLDNPHAYLCGYTNGHLGYLATEEEFHLGGYEVLWMPVVYGPVTGMLLPPAPSTASEVVDCFVRVARHLADSGSGTSALDE